MKNNNCKLKFLWYNTFEKVNFKSNLILLKNLNHSKFILASKKYKGFTLAEVLITLTVLGIIVALTIPSMMNNQGERANRTKIKKAIVNYEQAVENMRIANDLKTVGESDSTDETTLVGYTKANNYENAKSYFKIKQKGNEDYIFQTNDGVWWNIEPMNKPIISLNKDCVSSVTKDNSNACYNKSFYLKTDQGTATQGNAFIVNSSDGDAQYALFFAKIIDKLSSAFETCRAYKKNTCEVCKNNSCTTYKKVSISLNQADCSGTNALSAYKLEDHPEFGTVLANSCSNLKNTDIYVIEDATKLMATEDEAKNDEYCKTSKAGYEWCKTKGDYWNAAETNCKQQGGHLASLGELSALANADSKYNRGSYLASEESATYVSYYLLNGYLTHTYNDARSDGRVVCIGD